METTRTAKIFVDEFNILHVKILGGVIIDKEDAADNFLVARHLTGGKRFLKLVDSRKNYRIKKDARLFVERQNNSDIHIAKAILVGTLISKYLMEFFISPESPKFPQKIFTSEKKAIEWLKTFR
ncbi:MAG: hypothetical protein Q7W45_16770 [Bacteroidota bacterium]|nr:hypothetical protein [Bacteroidota bacterium]MDP3145332.1 hypothetical protein [Bacteroidota bacterium]HQX44924.1 hypothetical protein [Saprospiraceae bacterium]